MNTKPLEKFAQAARRQLKEQIAAKLNRVLKTDSAELRAQAEAVAELQKQIAHSSREAVVERVAYTWFNRFCALRYMDANQYTRMGVVSPAVGFTLPELLQEAKQGVMDDDLARFVDKQRVFDLLAGRSPSHDPQQEAYRLLLVGVCNQYHDIMPFLFEPIADYTELLMPDDLLSAGAVVQAVRETLTPEVCQDVEVIGWLYQFYIAEKKDEVFAGLKKNEKIAAENIPAATQLFTPHWIVRFLVENSLGRLWLLNRPNSRLAEQMAYYIKPEQTESDFLQVNSPEELKICDPAVGSAHMLTYAFDLLYAIYEEEGYNPPEIPRLILEKNLYGMEIDERAGALAAFALVMKARAKDRRFFRRLVQPHICVLWPITFSDGELEAEVMRLTATLTGGLEPTTHQPGLFASEKQLGLAEAGGVQTRRKTIQESLHHDLHLFKEADNYGSLLRPKLTAEQLAAIKERVLAEAAGGQVDWLVKNRRERVLRALEQAEYLTRKCHVVIANPPYMGNGGMNDHLKKFLNEGYQDVKSDLFSAFTVRIMEMTQKGGFISMMTPFNWMFLSSFEKLRQKILDESTLIALVRPEFHAFFDSAFVTICGFTLFTKPLHDLKGAFIDLDNFYGADVQPMKVLEAIQNPNCGWFYRASTTDFKKIPDHIIAYWVSEKFRNSFEKGKAIGSVVPIKSGMSTTDNNQFLRFWSEVSKSKTGLGVPSLETAKASKKKWFPYKKGGAFRRWYGNNDVVLNWYNDGQEIKKAVVNNPGDPHTTHWSRRIYGTEYFFCPGITWTKISSSRFSCRIHDEGYIFSDASNGLFPKNEDIEIYLSLLNSALAEMYLNVLSPTMNFKSGDIAKIPLLKLSPLLCDKVRSNTIKLIVLSRRDWDFYEISWDFSHLLLLQLRFHDIFFAKAYKNVRGNWREMTLEMQRLEEENNRLFIEAYGLQDELTPDVPLSEITLTCNPYYRYGAKKSEAELETLLLADTMREFISYAVGCMFGRYSLDKPGLILANQGETVADYLSAVGRQPSAISFMPDKDNAIPILDGDWFPDDISERFKRFLRLTFGESHYEENLAFLEKALGRDIQGYFLREFYDDHVKRYQKRPIYWLFSSPKGNFNVLIYMHRYRPDTVSVVLNDYLREFRAKLNGRKTHLQQVSISTAATPRDKTNALKEIDKLDKTLRELADYENDILYPLATQQVQIDLDDGVKVNYNKFGRALKPIAGLSEK